MPVFHQHWDEDLTEQSVSVQRIEDGSPTWWNKTLALKGPATYFQLSGLKKWVICMQHSAGFRMATACLQ